MRTALPFLLAALVAAPSMLQAQAGSGPVRGKVPAAQAGEFLGRRATVCGSVASARYAENAEGQPTFLFIGAAFPNHPFSVRIWGRDREKFGIDLTSLAGKTVCATGEIGRANNRPEIVVRSADKLEIS
jgi:hypothetical protein